MKATLTRRGLLTTAGLGVVAGAAWPAEVPRGLDCLDALLSQRRMVRRYRPDPVDDRAVRRLISQACRAPSAGDTQPWMFVVSRSAKRRKALAEAAFGQMFVAAGPVVITACADLSRSRERYAERGNQYALIDTAFAALLLLLAVVEEQLGACFVGAFQDREVARVLGLPDHVQPVALIPVGHPAESPGSHRPRPVQEVLRIETWAGES